MGPYYTYQSDFYEVVPCKFCGDDTRRVVCSSQSCDHQVCVKERGICFDCAREKLGDSSPPKPQLTLHAYYEVSTSKGEEADDFDTAIRLLEEKG